MGGWQTPPFDKALALSLPWEDSFDLLTAACQYCFGLDFFVPLDFAPLFEGCWVDRLLWRSSTFVSVVTTEEAGHLKGIEVSLFPARL